MNWKYKAILQRIISRMPFHDALNYVMQTYVTKGYPVPEPVFMKKIHNSEKHLRAHSQYLPGGTASDVFYEFGAGWDVLVPLIFASKGVQKQIVVDLNNLLRYDLIRDNIQRLKGKGYMLPGADLSDDKLLLRSLHVEYLAPFDARNTKFETSSIDFITNTDTMEHIPEKDLLAIMKESFRILKPGHGMSCVIDPRDHYAYFDKTINDYNFLKYSETEWAPYNNSLHYQNRLRHSDYVRLFKEAGFKIVHEELVTASAEELKWLSTERLAEQYKHYQPEDLGVKEIWIVVQK